MADNGNAMAYGTEMCGGFYSPMEAHNVFLENGETVEDAALVHGVDVDELVEKLNEAAES